MSDPTGILERLIDSLDRNTAAQLAGNESRAAAIAAAEKVTTSKPKTAAEKKAETDAAAAAAAAASTTSTTGAVTSGDVEAVFAKLTDDTSTYSVEDVKAAIVAYGNVERQEEVAARKAKTSEILGKVNAKKLSEIPENKFKAVIKAMKGLIDAGDLTEAPAGDDAGGESEDDLLG